MGILLSYHRSSEDMKNKRDQEESLPKDQLNSTQIDTFPSELTRTFESINQSANNNSKQKSPESEDFDFAYALLFIYSFEPKLHFISYPSHTITLFLVLLKLFTDLHKFYKQKQLPVQGKTLYYEMRAIKLLKKHPLIVEHKNRLFKSNYRLLLNFLILRQFQIINLFLIFNIFYLDFTLLLCFTKGWRIGLLLKVLERILLFGVILSLFEQFGAYGSS